MSRGGLYQVAPGLFQRGQTLTWPREQKLAMLDFHRIGLVVNLWVKVDPDLSAVVRYLNWPIPGDRAPDDIDDVVEVIVRSLGRDRPVLVHCEAGQNRSSYVCGLALARHEGLTGTEAWRRVVANNPRAKLRPALQQHLLAQGRPLVAPDLGACMKIASAS